MRILFLGQNPSNSAPNSVFENTRSLKTLQSWMKESGINAEIFYANVFDSSMIVNFTKTLITKEVASPKFDKKVDNNYNVIFTCGLVAMKAMDTYRTIRPGFAPIIRGLPHPSGLNRKLNDVKYVESVIRSMRETYESAITETRQGPKKGLDSSDAGSFNSSLPRQAGSVCPVVAYHRQKYKNS